MGDEPDVPADLLGVAGDIVPCDRHGAPRGALQCGDGLEQCRLSRAVRSEERDAFAGMHVEVDAIENENTAERPAESRDADKTLRTSLGGGLDGPLRCLPQDRVRRRSRRSERLLAGRALPNLFSGFQGVL
jgi:hypothetical protein